jgi:hypothetical protein
VLPLFPLNTPKLTLYAKIQRNSIWYLGETMKTKLYLLTIISVLVLAALACGSSTPSEPLPADVLFQDDFSDTSSGWDRVNVDDGVTDYVDGVYRIWVNTTSTDVWANPGLNFTDTIVEVEATKVGGPDDNDFGVICRYQDESNFYFFIISSDGYYGLGKVVGGEQLLIGEEELLPSDVIQTGNVTNTIRAECNGPNLTLSANGTQLASASDDTFSSGDVGLLAGTFDASGTDIHFDNFVVRQP